MHVSHISHYKSWSIHTHTHTLRDIPISKLLHDSAEDSGWYSLPIFHSLLCQNVSVPPLSVSRCQQFPPLRVHIPLFSAAAVIQTFRSKLMCQNRKLLLFICTSYCCAHSADRSVFLFLRKLWKWPANHSCELGARQYRKSNNGEKKQTEKLCSELSAFSAQIT